MKMPRWGMPSLRNRRSSQSGATALDAGQEVDLELEADGTGGVSAVPSRADEHAEALKQADLVSSFADAPHLDALRPRESYLFRSDHFQADDQFGCFLDFTHRGGRPEDYGTFWGIGMIPRNLDHQITTVSMTSFSTQTESWVNGKLKDTERLAKMARAEHGSGGTLQTQSKMAASERDRTEVFHDLQGGSAYLLVHFKLLVKAPTLELLDEAVAGVQRHFKDRFSTLRPVVSIGEQRQELSAVMDDVDVKPGIPFGFTTDELAGAYSLVTQGLADPAGQFVGQTRGDVNNSGVLLDIDGRFRRHITICDPTFDEDYARQSVSAVWASKVAQAVMENGHKVVHLVLDDTDLDQVGPTFEARTSRVDMSRGEVNMFEMYGSQADELSIFSAQLQKLRLMTRQLLALSGDSAVRVDNEISSVLTDFYVDQGMWSRNPERNRHRLRVVGIPHEDVPRLELFVSYLTAARERELNKSSTDPQLLETLGLLRGTFLNALNADSDLFNQHTSSSMDSTSSSQRVVYDFSSLARRGQHLALAQLVNILGYAVSNLERGDALIIHGAERITDPEVRRYLQSNLQFLFRRGGRVAWVYESIEDLLADDAMARLDNADFSIWGTMEPSQVKAYMDRLGRTLPPDLQRLITEAGEDVTYLRTGTANIVFHRQLTLGIDPDTAKRRQLSRGADERLVRDPLVEAAEAAERERRSAQQFDQVSSQVPAGLPETRRRRSRRRRREPGSQQAQNDN